MSRGQAIGLVVASVTAVSFGGATAKFLFQGAGPWVMAWLRVTVAGVVLGCVVGVMKLGTYVRRRHDSSPRPRRSRAAWLSLLGYAAALVTMNVVFYQGIARIPYGVAVTIEFLGPLTVAVVKGHGRRDLLWAGLAALGVVLLGWTPGGLTGGREMWIGIAFILAAATCWACYILIGPVVGRHWRGVEPVAYAYLFGAAVLTGPVLATRGEVLADPRVWLTGLVVGVLNSVLPYSLELAALRRLDQHTFSIFMSLEPGFAAVAGLVLLHEGLSAGELAAIACVAAASIGVGRQVRRRTG